MMGQQSQKESLFYYFRLEDQIPETHLLRLIDRSVDFSFVRDRLTRFYSPTGRPSIDPEVLLHRRGRSKAKVAVARKLLVRLFIMLRDQIDYDEFRRRGRTALASA